MGSIRKWMYSHRRILTLIGLILMVALEIRKVKGSILIGVFTVTGIAWAFHMVQ